MSAPPSQGPILSYSRGSTRGRGSRGLPRGRARGRGSQSLSGPARKTNNTWVAPGLASSAAPLPSTAKPAQVATTPLATAQPSQHKKFVLNGPVASTSTLPVTIKNSEQAMDVVVNGVAFIRSGRRLIRKPSAITSDGTPQKPTASTDNLANTPSRVSVAGQDYVRTKSGNLIAKSLVQKRVLQSKENKLNSLVNSVKSMQHARYRPNSRRPMKPLPRTKLIKKKDSLCRFFTKTGECRNALTCPYIHDSDKVSICPRFLRDACENTNSTCPLSHTPNAHRMPHCLHFPNCKNGTSCKYPHVHVAADANVCRDFAVIGWCEKGIDCPNKHVNECPEFSSSGTCTTKGCKLPHVIRRKLKTEEEEAQSGFIIDTAGAAAPESSGSSTSKRPLANDAAPLVVIGKKRRTDDMKANSDFITFMASDDEEEEQEEEQEIGTESESGSEEEDGSVDSQDYESSEHASEGLGTDAVQMDEEKTGPSLNEYKQELEEGEVAEEQQSASSEDEFDPNSLFVH